jgi:hypothetical protein
MGHTKLWRQLTNADWAKQPGVNMLRVRFQQQASLERDSTGVL